MGRRRVKPVYFLTLRATTTNQGSAPESDGEGNEGPGGIELTLAGLRPRDTARTVKELLEFKHGIPYSHQTLCGPMPSQDELPDHQSLRRSQVLLGRVVLPGAAHMILRDSDSEDEEPATKGQWRPPPQRGGGAGASSSGVLFSSSDAQLRHRAEITRAPITLGSGGSAGLGTPVDVLELVTLHPIEDYAEGGTYYQAQKRRRRIWSCVMWVVVLMVLGAVGFILWQVTYYKLPQAQTWMGGFETKLKRVSLQAKLRAAGIDPAEMGLHEDNLTGTSARVSADRLNSGEL